MKLIHVSDVRLGTSAEAGRPWCGERRGEMIGTFERVLEKAVREKVSLLLISGGLFSREPLTAEMDDVNRIFEKYPSIQIVITAGREDMVRRHSPVRSFRWADNVHYVLTAGPEHIFFPELGVHVFAGSVCEGEDCDVYAFEKALKESGAEGSCIALCCEPVEAKAADAFRGSSFSCALLGGRSRASETVKNRVYYCGSLEPETMKESGSHGIYLGTLTGEGLLIGMEFIPMASASYVPLVVTVTPATEEEEFLRFLEKKILERGTKHIYRIRINGKRDPEQCFDLDSIARKYRIAEIIDETEPEYDFSELFEKHPQDLIGFYISALRKDRHVMSSMEKKAMYYGIDALLHTADRPSEGEKK